MTTPQPPPDIEPPNPGDPGVPAAPDDGPREAPPGREPEPDVPESDDPTMRLPGENPDVETEI